MTTIRITLCALALVASGTALATIPAPVLDDAAKAKAAEAAAKTAWQGKVDAYQLCKSQDKVAAYYKKGNAPASAKDAKAVKTAAAPAAAASGAGAAPVIPPCADPGPFVYTPPGAAAPTTAAAPAAAAPAKAPAAAPAKKS